MNISGTTDQHISARKAEGGGAVYADLTVIILTFNEERHLRRCLESLRGLAKRVVVVDCFSTDDTVALAKTHGAEVVQHTWVNHSSQLNWALDNIPIDTQWTMRLDADEVVTPELGEALRRDLPGFPGSVMGITVDRRVYFLGRWIRHGGVYPVRLLRVWRSGYGRCEDRWMDEHMLVSGALAHVRGDISDINLNNITWWTSKHNHYATREAVDLLLSLRNVEFAVTETHLNRQAKIKRWLKLTVYAKLPLGLRAFLYFHYRYFFRMGFLDGWQGFAFHFLQGFWYRFLVDVKVNELRGLTRGGGLTLEEAVKHEFGYEI